MNESYLQCVEIEPAGVARASVIWLHGLGADGHDFEPIVPYLGIPDTWGVRFVFPTAPSIPVTINSGAVMPAWYDIRNLELGSRADMDGVRVSSEAVARLITRENERGVPSSRVVLAGFSQGGVIALHLGLRYPETLAGLIALSTYLAGEEGLDGNAGAPNRATPIFQAHGDYDPMVPAALGQKGRDRLVELGYAVHWKTYPMQHEVSGEEIQELGEWLRGILSPEGS